MYIYIQKHVLTKISEHPASNGWRPWVTFTYRNWRTSRNYESIEICLIHLKYLPTVWGPVRRKWETWKSTSWEYWHMSWRGTVRHTCDVYRLETVHRNWTIFFCVLYKTLYQMLYSPKKEDLQKKTWLRKVGSSAGPTVPIRSRYFIQNYELWKDHQCVLFILWKNGWSSTKVLCTFITRV